MTTEEERSLIEITSAIVSAFVSNNAVRSAELSDIILAVHASLREIGKPKAEQPAIPTLAPAVSVRKSITDDYLICLDDGLKFKSLKRHLSILGMTPDDYRAKWGLPRDYPMVAPGYAAKRSELAKASGLGASRRPAEAIPTVSVPEVDSTPKRGRGRPSKASPPAASIADAEVKAKVLRRRRKLPVAAE